MFAFMIHFASIVDILSFFQTLIASMLLFFGFIQGFSLLWTHIKSNIWNVTLKRDPYVYKDPNVSAVWRTNLIIWRVDQNMTTLNECIISLIQFDWIGPKNQQISVLFWNAIKLCWKAWMRTWFQTIWVSKNLSIHLLRSSELEQKIQHSFESRFQINAFKNKLLTALKNNNNNRDICELSFNFATD
jgi:hypothetical protein